MKNKSILFIAMIGCFLIGCAKLSNEEITSEKPQNLKMPYYGDVDIQLPEVPEYTAFGCLDAAKKKSNYKSKSWH